MAEPRPLSDRPKPIVLCEEPHCRGRIPLGGVASGELVACPKCGRFAVPSPRCDEDQLAILKRCSKAKDITEWTQWGKDNPAATVWLQHTDLESAHLGGTLLAGAHLEGARLYGVHLEGAFLWGAHLEAADLRNAHLESAGLWWACLEGADLTFANLEGASLRIARLEGADLKHARLEGAGLYEAHLERADLREAHLERAGLTEAHLEGARLWGVHLQGACLNGAHLEGAHLSETHLEGARLSKAHLEGADFTHAIVDGATLVDTPFIDRDTDFTGVGLGECRLGPGLRQTLEYTIRRKRWEAHADGTYRVRRAAKAWARAFWWISDYGRSTARIVRTFIGASGGFAALYWLFGLFGAGLVTNLFPADITLVSAGRALIRSIYFSIVTMTTLGFGDITADPASTAGHIALTVQVLLGYVLLGALICRLAILFQSDGPPVRFPDEMRRQNWLAWLFQRTPRRLRRLRGWLARILRKTPKRPQMRLTPVQTVAAFVLLLIVLQVLDRTIFKEPGSAGPVSPPFEVVRIDSNTFTVRFPDGELPNAPPELRPPAEASPPVSAEPPTETITESTQEPPEGPGRAARPRFD